MDIKFHKVDKSYQGKPVLRQLSWHITDGELWQVTGQSGIGKTTLLRLLLGLEKPDCGQITGRENVFMTAMFQEHRLCGWLNARQNIALVCQKNREEIEDMLTQLLPQAYLSQPIDTLSGGMRQRVALVRAVITESALITLDEPFAGLDAQNKERAVEFILRHRRGRTIVFVSHEQPPNLPPLQKLALSYL